MEIVGSIDKFVGKENCMNIKVPNLFHSINLEDLDTKRASESEFQLISEDELAVQSKSYDDKNASSGLLRSSIKLEQSNNNSIWSFLNNKLSNLTNNLKYNVITTNSYVDFRYMNYVRLFDKFFTSSQLKTHEFESLINSLIQMTYRSQIPLLMNGDRCYTSDCGWGCMIRVAQMMLSKAIVENKIFNFLKTNNQMNNDDLTNIKLETIMLFFDNDLKLDHISDNGDFKYLLKSYVEIINEEEQSKDEVEVQQDKIMNNDEYLSSKHTSKNSKNGYEVTPPFSIQNICKLGVDYDKFPGDWFSDVVMASIFSRINKEFQAIENLEVINFNDGIIDEIILLEKCFQIVKCEKECNLQENHTDESEEHYRHSRTNLSANCENKLREDSDNLHLIKKQENFYKFVKGGLIFVSVRHGLREISKDYHESVRHIFKIPYNIGIMGGKKFSAIYIIGETDTNKLIYLDPHINQIAIKDIKSIDPKNQYDSYMARYFYQIDIASISPAFTVGFYFRTIEEYISLMDILNIHDSLQYPIFKLRTDQITHKNSNQNIKIPENDEDGFCIIEYEGDI